MLLGTLTQQEQKLVQDMIAGLAPSELNSYQGHLDIGYVLSDPADILMTASLHQKGWLTFALDLLDEDYRVWLTLEAWELFGLDEWNAVEEAIAAASRPKHWGAFS